jgi:hypothetical protein
MSLMSRAGFSRRHTSRPSVALCPVGAGLHPAELNVRLGRTLSMPKPYDHERRQAACSEIRPSCARARLTELERRTSPIANPYSHTWIRISLMVSVTYEQFPAKPLKINDGRERTLRCRLYSSARSRIPCGERFGSFSRMARWATSPPAARIIWKISGGIPVLGV